MVATTDGNYVLHSEAQAEIDALKAQRDALLAAQQWRDIESAPKDSSNVLVLFGVTNEVVAAYCRDIDKKWFESFYHAALNNGSVKAWQPLPPLPNAKTGGKS